MSSLIGAGAVDAASPAGVCGVKAFGDLLGEGPGRSRLLLENAAEYLELGLDNARTT